MKRYPPLHVCQLRNTQRSRRRGLFSSGWIRSPLASHEAAVRKGQAVVETQPDLHGWIRAAAGTTVDSGDLLDVSLSLWCQKWYVFPARERDTAEGPGEDPGTSCGASSVKSYLAVSEGYRNTHDGVPPKAGAEAWRRAVPGIPREVLGKGSMHNAEQHCWKKNGSHDDDDWVLSSDALEFGLGRQLMRSLNAT